MTATATKDTKNSTATTDQRIEKIEKGLEAVINKLGNTPAYNPADMFARRVRTGEDPNSSRGFSFMKMMGHLRGFVDADQCKVERDISDRLHKSYVTNMRGQGYQPKGMGAPSSPGGTFLAPLATSFLEDDVVGREFRKEMRERVVYGTDGADHDEMKWIRAKMLQEQYGIARHKALSWLNELNGGSVVAPPEMGELIELLRNKEALVNAGARVVPLPPQGRIKYPRQTAASSTYWIGENAPITESQIGTGEVTLQAKKLAVLMKAPNELLRFASPAAEALMRDDMTKSLALGLDLAALEGTGGDTRPLGIINQAGVNVVNSGSPGVDGDGLIGQDIYRMVAVVEEQNAEFEGFIMRPKTLYRYYQLRWDAIGQGDSAGGFLFSLIREPGEGTKPSLAGFPVTKSTQVSQVRVKGAGTNLTYIVGGMWSDYLIGMFGAIEFAASVQGDTPFQNDQTWVRGILTADSAPRHAAAFCFMDNLQVNG